MGVSVGHRRPRAAAERGETGITTALPFRLPVSAKGLPKQTGCKEGNLPPGAASAAAVPRVQRNHGFCAVPYLLSPAAGMWRARSSPRSSPRHCREGEPVTVNPAKMTQ